MWPDGKTRNDRGATAIMMALLSAVIFMVGAVAIDMGQVYAKRAALQSNVDMAVLAAAAELDREVGCNPEAVTKAVEYLQKATNKVHGQVALALQDGNANNGEITCPGNWRVQLRAPEATVSFGMAKVFEGDDSVDVPALATAQVKSAAASTSLPMYAVQGCDSGQQQLSDPPPGPPPSNSPPPLTPNGTAQIKNLTVTPSEVADGASEPVQMTVSFQVHNAAPGTTGQVTFTNPAGGAPVPAGSAVALPSGPWAVFSITVPTVPQSVLDADGIWWVRIKTVNGAAVNYSPTNEAEPFTVGDLLFCDGAVSGNFGTLHIARSTGTPATWLEQNMIKGLEPLLKVNASSAVPCSPVDSVHSPTHPTDCVGTDPGFPGEAATDGLVGTDSAPGRLRKPTTPGCDRTGGDSETGTAPALNDDMLSCFILGGHSVGDLVAGVPNILSADILHSPRFFMLPIIPVEAANGASSAYPIVGFRPGFITEEPLTATQGNPGAINGHNGVHFHSNRVERLNVLLFNEASLPATAPAVGGEADYDGAGMKVITLVE